ncbi:bifunctional diguanylate cyclase/phosphodiesterase [uncultured Neptuniibacter sp.]|uniref:sensor domain-containing protein n=1 Tax=uncultured Neptuniibacter sp. TaxID=502143 RepID=UPI002639232E|nr:diguanylate cyclase [uncultured Neptuniibacter sp.]
MSVKNKSATAPPLTAELSVLSHIEDMVSIIDHNYIYRAVSHGYELFFGRSSAEIIGQSAELLHGSEVFNNILKPTLDKTFAGEEVHFQFSRTDHLGNLRHLDSKHTLYSGPLTEGDGIAVVSRDITETVNAKNALEHEQALLNTIINSIPDFIFAKDNDGRYQVCNQSFAEFLAQDKDQIIGKTDYELMSFASAEFISGKDQQVIATLEPQRNDEWVHYKDGRRRLLDMLKLPLQVASQEHPGVLGIGRNVTYEREAEQNLLLSSLVFDATPDPCMILSSEGLIISSNHAAKTQFEELRHANNLPFNDIFYCPSDKSISLDLLLGKKDIWHGQLGNNIDHTFLATINRVKGQARQSDKFVLIIRDEDTHHRFTENLLDKAYQDPLTGLPNRRLLFSRLESAITRAERQMTQLAVLYIDLNKFKPINDIYGHSMGDRVLIEVAHRLRSCFRTTDTVARLGGDEFVALVDIENSEQAATIAEKVHQNLIEPFSLNDQTQASAEISASIGISLFPSDAGSANELLEKADEAMYKAKRDPAYFYQFSN